MSNVCWVLLWLHFSEISSGVVDLSMRLDMELEFDKYCVVDENPTNILPSPQRRPKVEKRKSKRSSRCGNDISSLNVDEDFTEILLHRYRSASCKVIPSSTSCREENAAPRRGSVYHSSKEAHHMKKFDAVEGRRKIEISRSSGAAVSFGIVDSLCSVDENSSHEEMKRSSVMSMNSDLSTASTSRFRVESDNRENQCARKAERRAIKESKIISKSVVYPLNGGNGTRERDSAVILNKSLPHSSSQASSPKPRFTPFRKMFEPFVKSKSHKSPLNSSIESRREIPSELVTISQNKAMQKPECDSQPEKKDKGNSPPECSPAHLHGSLKLENKDGVPFFEFVVKCPEEMLVAKTWKVKDSLSWIYTFHSSQNKRKSNVSGWGLKDSKRESSMVGQMQVSCYLCQEINKASLDISIVNEFVLYDIARLRKKVSSKDNSSPSPEVSKGSTSSHENPSNSHPLAAVELHPDLESAAIVVQVPFETIKSSNVKNGDAKIDQTLTTLLALPEVEQRNENIHIRESSSPAKVSVVVSSGNHGLPSTDSRGPSSLLDRWRLGGGCDCGGWDMACPLHVFNNSSILVSKDHFPLKNQRPVELFFQGKKVNAPTLTMMLNEDGHYAVDFHAQLSPLQAFSICISILHSIETSSVVSNDNNKQLLQCDSLRLFVEDKIRSSIEPASEEGKCRVSKKIDDILPSFIVYPPFSPVARV